jgi:hypothetical protein
MNYYLSFSFEIISIFLSYLFKQFDNDSNSINEVSPEIISYICEHLLSYGHYNKLDSALTEDSSILYSKYDFDSTNQILQSFLQKHSPHIQLKLSPEAYTKLVNTINPFLYQLKHHTLDSFIIPSKQDYGFSFNYQNQITHVILKCLTSLTNWLNFTMIEEQDIQFVKDCLFVNHLDEYVIDSSTPDILNLQSILTYIFQENQLYITSNALHECTKLWMYLNNQPLSMRIIAFDTPISTNF